MQCKALFFFFLLSSSITAQNLVPNGSFEDYISCPQYLDGMEFVEHWYKSIIYPGLDYYQNPSPDYFHECAPSTGLGVPDNIIGSQYAHVGSAYSGLFTYNSTWPLNREVMGVSLTAPLEPGQTYHCSLYFVRAVGWSQVGLATNNLGMKFSHDEFFSSTAEATDGTAHVVLNELGIDSANWTLLYAQFTPEEPYQYLHIGNFFSTEMTEIESYSDLSTLAYYFIDDVRVEPSFVTNVEQLKPEHGIVLYPNPTSDFIKVRSETDIRELQIYASTGKQMFSESWIDDKEFDINVSSIKSGLYIVIAFLNDGELKSLKFIKN